MLPDFRLTPLLSGRNMKWVQRVIADWQRYCKNQSLEFCPSINCLTLKFPLSVGWSNGLCQIECWVLDQVSPTPIRLLQHPYWLVIVILRRVRRPIHRINFSMAIWSKQHFCHWPDYEKKCSYVGWLLNSNDVMWSKYYQNKGTKENLQSN